MKKLRVAALLAGGVGLSACLIIACGDDDTTDVPGVDSGTDASKDVNASDASDASSEDAGDGGDGGDAGSLTGNDLVLGVATAYCHSLSRCCFGAVLDAGAPVDGGGAFPSGTYDEATCFSISRGSGFEGSLKDVQGLFGADAGNVTLDQANAASCIQKLSTISCTLGKAEFVAIRDACFGATNGTLAAGATCASSVQCGANLFCNATTKKCETFRAEAASCAILSDAGTEDLGRNDEACSTRASGDTGRYCDMLTNRDDKTTWTCKAQNVNGNACDNSSACGQGFCSTAIATEDGDGNYTCRSDVAYFPRDPDSCGALVLPPSGH